jgi:hypothetical protein
MHLFNKSIACIGLLAGLLAVLGCGPSKRPIPDTTIKGTVTKGGKLVQSGAIIFRTQDTSKRELPYHIVAIKEGKFEVKNIALGRAQVGVTNNSQDAFVLIRLGASLSGKGATLTAVGKVRIKDASKERAKGLRGMIDTYRQANLKEKDIPEPAGREKDAGPIDEKYLDPESSPLEALDVKHGENKYDITLE